MSIVKEIDKISGTDTRSKNIEDAVKKLELGGGIFAVNITYDGSTATHAADKTFNEIVDAFNNGKLCVAYYGTGIMYLVSCAPNYACFSNVRKGASELGDTPDTLILSIYITNNNRIIEVY